MTEVTREDFDRLCAVVDTILGAPGGVDDMRHLLSFSGHEALREYAEMRRRRE